MRRQASASGTCGILAASRGGVSGSLIAGYTARLDGPDGIRFDRKELAAAEWHPRTGHPDGLTDISIAYEMIEALRL